MEVDGGKDGEVDVKTDYKDGWVEGRMEVDGGMQRWICCPC